MSPDDDHRALRESLGSYALGHLDQGERASVEAHLERCEACRRELDEITPVAARLHAVDARVLEELPATPDLGDHLRTSLVRESAQREHERRGRRLSTSLLAAAALVAVAAAGAGLGRATAPETPAVPLEAVELTQAATSPIEVTSAGVVAHTWGVELRMEGDGFADGRTYRAFFVAKSGEVVPAGEFLGTGGEPMTCFLQSAVLREDVTMVLVRDDQGRAVLRSRL